MLSLPDINSCKHSDERDVVGLLNKWLRSKFTKGKDEMSPSSLKDEVSKKYTLQVLMLKC